MSLENFTVRRKREHNLRAKNYASETQVYDTARIVYAIPSISKKDGVTDGLVNTEVKIDDGEIGGIKLWVTELVATIEALDD